MVLAAIFRAKNNTLTERLRITIQNNNIMQAILKEIDQGDIKKFTKKDRFLLF